jgi:hypothetical protein
VSFTYISKSNLDRYGIVLLFREAPINFGEHSFFWGEQIIAKDCKRRWGRAIN